MSNEQHIHELIDQYLMGELIGQELDKFKIRLKDDPAFLREVQIQKAIIQGIEAQRKADLKAMLAEKTRKTGFIIPFGTRPLAIAATLLSILAFGLVLKTVLPAPGGEVATSDKIEVPEGSQNQNESEPNEDQRPPDAENRDWAALDEKPTAPKVDAPPIEIAEVEDEAIAEEESVTLSNDVDVDFSELKKDEDQIDGSRFNAKRDTMLGSKNIPLWVYNYNNAVVSTGSRSSDSGDLTKTTTAETEDKESRKKRKRRDKNDDAIEEDKFANTEDVEQAAPILKKTPAQTIQVQYWHSIVNFKGYKFDGTKLLLFDTPQDTPLKLITYGGVTYLNKAGTFYALVPNNNFNQLSRVQDANILKVLNQ